MTQQLSISSLMDADPCHDRDKAAVQIPRPGFRMMRVIPMPLTERQMARFWQSVEKSDGCWEWTARRIGNGRPVFAIGQLTYYAYRVSYVLHFGPIPDGLLICHHCDNELCVRPDHLFAGTAKDNAQDALRKGRLKFPARLTGVDHPTSKMTPELLAAVHTDYLSGNYSQAELASKYGVCQHSIGSWLRAAGVSPGKGRHLRAEKPCAEQGCDGTASTRRGSGDLCTDHRVAKWKREHPDRVRAYPRKSRARADLTALAACGEGE